MFTMVKANISQALILVIEDNCEDYETTVRAFRKAGVESAINRCNDGDEAIDYLLRRGDYAQRPDALLPTIILLDLNMPGTDGFEVLAIIKQDDSLKSIPVIILSTSASQNDIEFCYKAGANSYLEKPVDLEGFLNAIKRVKEYWLETVELL